ncbi:MAG: universal stress protein [Burkholderiaceae bacterium]|nr:universal stress protein [Burkholderiaceae bacterium]MCD6672435.1 universal stress protein [Burkholderiaceae bacterium]
MKLLVAIDGSENSLRAARFAASLLGQLRNPGSITLISVHDDVALRNARRFVGKQVVDEYLRDLSEQDLAGARELLDGLEIAHDQIIRIGAIANEIAQAADPDEFAMVVLGSKGRTGLRDLLIGSVARRVSEISRIPVLLVK